MDKMTPNERAVFARGKVKSNLDDLRVTLDHQRRDSINQRKLWIVVTCFTSIALSIAFLYHGLQNIQDVVFDAAISVSFITTLAMFYQVIVNQIMFSDLLLELYSDLVNSETLRFGTEDMAASNSKPVAQ